jgi:hypothetical protein
LRHPEDARVSDACPNCGATFAPDQRYCLACGQRRGDPRLPFMDAVVFMEASKRPQPTAAPVEIPPPSHRPPVSANASLVAGVATLVLAIGVGVMIGRSGDNSSNTASAAPQIIRVGGGEDETATASQGDEGSAAIAGGGGKSKSATAKKAKEKAKTGSSGASKATEEVFEPAPGVKIAPPEQKLGGDCDPSVAGCNEKGEFEGTFFE